MNPKPLTSGNSNATNIDSELSRWFLSLVCLDSPVHAISQTRGRSAFSCYLRPTIESKQRNVSLLDSTFDEDEDKDSDSNENSDKRDDVESDSPSLPCIERTFSFDDWDDADDYCPATPMSPTAHVFRFDDWSAVSKNSDATTNLPSSVNKSSSEMLSCLDSTVKTTNQTYHNNDNLMSHESSSTIPMIPPTHSYLFQPIPDGSSSRLSVSLTAPPSLSIRSIDLLSLDDEVENITNNHHVTTPECPGIPRVGSNKYGDDEEDDLFHPVIFSIHMDDMRTCISSPTNHHGDYHVDGPRSLPPPIPQVIFLPRQSKGWRRTIQRSWKRILSIRRRENCYGRNKRMSLSGRRCLPRNGLRGEF